MRKQEGVLTVQALAEQAFTYRCYTNAQDPKLTKKSTTGNKLLYQIFVTSLGVFPPTTCSSSSPMRQVSNSSGGATIFPAKAGCKEAHHSSLSEGCSQSALEN